MGTFAGLSAICCCSEEVPQSSRKTCVSKSPDKYEVKVLLGAPRCPSDKSSASKSSPALAPSSGRKHVAERSKCHSSLRPAAQNESGKEGAKPASGAGPETPKNRNRSAGKEQAASEHSDDDAHVVRDVSSKSVTFGSHMEDQQPEGDEQSEEDEQPEDEQPDHVIKVNSVSSFTSRFVDEAFQTSELSPLHRSSVRRNTPFFALTRRPTLQEQELEVATEAELPSMALLQSNVQRSGESRPGDRCCNNMCRESGPGDLARDQLTRCRICSQQ